jgi:hypothetical protein
MQLGAEGVQRMHVGGQINPRSTWCANPTVEGIRKPARGRYRYTVCVLICMHASSQCWLAGCDSASHQLHACRHAYMHADMQAWSHPAHIVKHIDTSCHAHTCPAHHAACARCGAACRWLGRRAGEVRLRLGAPSAVIPSSRLPTAASTSRSVSSNARQVDVPNVPTRMFRSTPYLSCNVFFDAEYLTQNVFTLKIHEMRRPAQALQVLLQISEH